MATFRIYLLSQRGCLITSYQLTYPNAMLPGTSWYQSTKTPVLPRKEKRHWLTERKKKAKERNQRLTVTELLLLNIQVLERAPNPAHYLLPQWLLTLLGYCLLLWAKQQVYLKTFTRVFSWVGLLSIIFGCLDNTKLLEILLIRMVLITLNSLSNAQRPEISTSIGTYLQSLA